MLLRSAFIEIAQDFLPDDLNGAETVSQMA